MRKEVEIPYTEFHQLASELSDTFIQRRDLYPRQKEDGSYVCIYKPLKDRHLVAHLKGVLTLGAYVLDRDSQARFIVFDADDDRQKQKLWAAGNDLASMGAPAYLETSRRGGHLWLFLPQPVSGKAARAFGNGLLKAYDLDGIELFPKQARLTTGPGSLIRLPFGVHRKSGLRYGFYTVDEAPLAGSLREQIHVLSAPQTVPAEVFEVFRERSSPPRSAAISRPSEALTGALSERIKEGTTVHDFVVRYVDLSPAGRGLCPFHDDHHASFSVNAEENYWHCFAGCGGGSLIDFWIKWHDCDFKTAVDELAKMLL